MKKNILLLAMNLIGLSLFAQCPLPPSAFVGEYNLEQTTPVHPQNGAPSFNDQVVTLSQGAAQDKRVFSAVWLEDLQIFQPPMDISFSLDCNNGDVIMDSDLLTGLTCNTGDGEITLGPAASTGSFVTNDDGSFTLILAEYVNDGGCNVSPPLVTEFTLTKKCSKPQNIEFLNPTPNSVEVSWMDTNDTASTGNTYTLEYGQAGFSPGSGQVVTGISGNSAIINNLQEDTAYDFYLSASCTNGTSSEVAGPYEYGFYDNPDFTLAANGVTCLCPNANVGDKGTLTINGEAKLFTKRTRAELDALIANDIHNTKIELTCTSDITDMSNLFELTNFDQNLSHWDVSSVTTMNSMFSSSPSFNQPLNIWDVSNVTNMTQMFSNASNFDQDISSWDFETSNLANFLNDTRMSSSNYDLLIDKLVAIDFDNGTLDAENINYCDAFSRQQLIDEGWSINDGGIAEDCDLNYVSGEVLFDEMNDGCDADDNGLSGYLINANNGIAEAGFAIDDNGQYLIPLESGNYTLSILNLNTNLNATPSTQSINLSMQNELIQDIDFCVTANQAFDDLSVSLLPLEDAIPGFETTYQLVVNNYGSQTAPNVQTTFSYDDNFQTFFSATETPSGNMANLLTFELVDLQPFSQKIIEVTLLNAMPPTLSGGEDLNFTAQVTPDVNDVDPDNNTADLKQTVVNSFDPNDKLAVQGDEIVDEDIDRYLDYRIRFQNVGTANALNVKITDTISDKLDWTTFHPISASHDYRVEIIEGEQINFYFDNIDLPYEDLDEEGSNGFITYKIKPKSNVQIGDVIENTAYIYFDFNPPIVTNTVSTTVVDELSTEGFVKQESIRLFPNPADDQVELINNSDAEILQLKLYSINGKLISSFNDSSILDVSQLSSGVYILQLETRYNKINKRLIKR